MLISVLVLAVLVCAFWSRVPAKLSYYCRLLVALMVGVIAGGLVFIAGYVWLGEAYTLISALFGFCAFIYAAKYSLYGYNYLVAQRIYKKRLAAPAIVNFLENGEIKLRLQSNLRFENNEFTFEFENGKKMLSGLNMFKSPEIRRTHVLYVFQNPLAGTLSNLVVSLDSRTVLFRIEDQNERGVISYVHATFDELEAYNNILTK
ncbi:hypothetical protein JXH92_003665 [Salmonella enterica subsp. enterica serovar 4,[5],12:b:-]|nr:hypothetical protein [Salmonella enterica subsp. enterica serovar 4,[5],12:b:-]